MSLGGLGQGAVSSISDFLQLPADKYGNNADVEVQWAIQAYHHAEVYFSLVKTVDPTLLKLTPLDSEIYKHMRESFGDMPVDKINEDELKSAESKAKWREFCEQYKGRVEDYNMGTLLRMDAGQDISDQNTALVPRIQFLAIEIARNREGCNSGLRQKYGAASQGSASDSKQNKESETNKDSEKSETS